MDRPDDDEVSESAYNDDDLKRAAAGGSVYGDRGLKRVVEGSGPPNRRAIEVTAGDAEEALLE